MDGTTTATATNFKNFEALRTTTTATNSLLQGDTIQHQQQQQTSKILGPPRTTTTATNSLLQVSCFITINIKH